MKNQKVIATAAHKGEKVFSPTIFGEVPSNRFMRTHDLPETYRLVWATPAGDGEWLVGDDVETLERNA